PIRQQGPTSAEYLTPDEVERLRRAAAKAGRHGERDDALIMLACRHGLRVSELVALRWDHVDLKQGLLHVSRAKNGIASVHPLRGAELRALRKLARLYPTSPYVFSSERKGPLTTDAVRKIVTRAGDEAGFRFPYTRTCCATRAATSSPTTARIRARSSIISATGNYTTR